MDETYAEDSFVVGSEVEEEESNEEDAADVELMPEDSYVDGKKQYATRRRVFLHKARARAGVAAKTAATPPAEQRAGVKAKRSRVLRMNDSSEEETEEVGKNSNVAVPLWPRTVPPEPVRLQQQQKAPSSSSSSSTIASKVALLSKARRCSATEDQQNEM